MGRGDGEQNSKFWQHFKVRFYFMMFPVPFIRAVLVGAECGRRRANSCCQSALLGEGKKNKSIFNNTNERNGMREEEWWDDKGLDAEKERRMSSMGLRCGLEGGREVMGGGAIGGCG